MQNIAAHKRSRGRLSYESGLSAEDRICEAYEARGLVLARKRWRGKSGEIDLVMREGETVVFVEVKQSRDFEKALSHLTPRQITRLFQAAEEFVANEPRGALTDVRFDVALVDQQGTYRIIENAFA